MDDFVSSAKLIVDGVAINSSSIDVDTITFDEDFVVPQNTTIDYELVLILSDKDLEDGATHTFTVDMTYLLYNVNDEDNTNPEDFNDNMRSTFTIDEHGSLELAMKLGEDNLDAVDYIRFTDKDKHVAFGSQEVVLAKIELDADKEDMKVKDIYFSATGSAATALDDTIDNVKLYDADFNLIDQGTTEITGGMYLLKFEDLMSNFIVSEGELDYAYVVVDLKAYNPNGSNTTATGSDISVALYTGYSDGIVVEGYESSDSSKDYTDILTSVDTTDSNGTVFVATVPTSIEFLPVDAGRGSGSVIAKLQITMDDNNLNKDESNALIEAILSGLDVTVTTFGTTDATNIEYSRNGVTNAVVANLGTNAEIDNGQATFLVIADTDPGTDENPRINISLDLATEISIDDGLGNITVLNTDHNDIGTRSFTME